MKTLVIIPAFNEASTIGRVIRSVKRVLPQAGIVVVNDGSSDNTQEVAAKEKVVVLNHVINRGLGGAIGTGVAFAKQNDYDYAITIDADGQHKAQDILKLMRPLKNNEADVVIGSRMINRTKMPWDRYVINQLANTLTLVIFGFKTTDSQSGFRGFNRQAIEGIRLRTDRMEVSTEIFSEIKRLRLRYEEVPIKVIYTNYSRTKGQTNTNAFNILFKLVLRLFR